MSNFSWHVSVKSLPRNESSGWLKKKGWKTTAIHIKWLRKSQIADTYTHQREKKITFDYGVEISLSSHAFHAGRGKKNVISNLNTEVRDGVEGWMDLYGFVIFCSEKVAGIV